jgi:hypothetical protein
LLAEEVGLVNISDNPSVRRKIHEKDVFCVILAISVVDKDQLRDPKNAITYHGGERREAV